MIGDSLRFASAVTAAIRPVDSEQPIGVYDDHGKIDS